jgi:hypothetical protein
MIIEFWNHLGLIISKIKVILILSVVKAELFAVHVMLWGRP